MRTAIALLAAVVLCGCVKGYKADMNKSSVIDRYIDKDNGVVCYFVGGYYGRAISCLKTK